MKIENIRIGPEAGIHVKIPPKQFFVCDGVYFVKNGNRWNVFEDETLTVYLRAIEKFCNSSRQKAVSKRLK